MEETEKYLIEDLLPAYFTDEINEEDREKVDLWKKASLTNSKLFDEIAAAWKSAEILGQMEQFNSKEALKKVDKRLRFGRAANSFRGLQKVAAILLVPILIYAGGLTYLQFTKSGYTSEKITWQEVKTTTGMISELELPDGTHVWLNSQTRFKYPLTFGKVREVVLNGEAYFDVVRDTDHPFIVNTGTMNVEVLGTSFNVTNYPEENQTEVVLRSGKVNLFTDEFKNKKEIGFLVPGQQALFNKKTQRLMVNRVDPDKYTSWKEGKLIFTDDSMSTVVHKLSRWFNVDIVLENKELDGYVYRGTFGSQSLRQILDLLKISAPIGYTIKPGKQLPDGSFSKERIIIRKIK